MKILVTGKDGQLGWELARALLTLGDVIAVGRAQMDLENADTIRSTIRTIRPDMIINAAAYTAVDQAETDMERAQAINGIAPGIMAEEAKLIGASIIHYSTDYVFNGTKDTAYTEEDIPNPLNVYGRSKLAGEQAIAAVGGSHLILRTSWVYGNRGRNFLKTVLRLADERNRLTIIDDQIGAPTWSRLIAQATAHILAARQPFPQKKGVYHLTASGSTSWYGFASAAINSEVVALKKANRKTPNIIPIPSSEYRSAATRPANSRLSCNRLARDYHISLPDWMTGLHLCLEDL